MWFFSGLFFTVFGLNQLPSLQRKVNKWTKNPQIMMYCHNSQQATLSKQQPLAWTSNNFPRLAENLLTLPLCSSLWELIISRPPVLNQLFLWCVSVMTYATLSEQKSSLKISSISLKCKKILLARLSPHICIVGFEEWIEHWRPFLLGIPVTMVQTYIHPYQNI